MPERIVIALGGNALQSGNSAPTAEAQLEVVKKTSERIAEISRRGYEMAVVHGNGPQVGRIVLAGEAARDVVPPMPFDVCGAMSQGYIGYDLQNGIREELLNRGIYRTVSTVLTQVIVDPYDDAFYTPTKVLGRYMNAQEANEERKKGNYVIEEPGKGFRRVVSAPNPVKIVELDAVKALLDANQVVIAAGGGGIPVMEQGTTLKGASAVIEKDYTAAKLADMVDASHLMILTAREYMTTKDTDEKLEKISVSDAIKLMDEGNFDPITTLPKVDACVSFVSSGEGRTAIITKLEEAYQGIKERIGTIIK